MAEAYAVALCMDRGQTVRLHFWRKEKAAETYDRVAARTRGEDTFEIEVEDDYGTKITFNRDNLAFVTLEDPKRLAEAEVERGLIVARANASGQKRAMDDPMLKLLASGGGLQLPRA